MVIVEFYFYHNYMGAEGARMARNLGGVPIATMVTPANPINKAQNAHCLASFCLPIVTLATSQRVADHVVGVAMPLMVGEHHREFAEGMLVARGIPFVPPMQVIPQQDARSIDPLPPEGAWFL